MGKSPDNTNTNPNARNTDIKKPSEFISFADVLNQSQE
jgi:hypothetical protein